MRRVTFLGHLMVALSMVLALPASAQVSDAARQLQETPAGRMALAWLEAVNSGDAARVREFTEKNFSPDFLSAFPIEQHVKMQMGGLAGGMEPLRVQRATATEVVLLARPRREGATMTVRVGVEPEPPHKITGIGVRPSDPVMDEAPPPPMAEAEILSELERFLAAESKEGRFSGTVLVAKEGRPLFQRAYGLADRESNTPNTLATRFNLGSMNKMFTSVAIGQLAEQGKLKYTDTIARHLPEYPNQEVAQKVTLHHLLTHTSGMGNYMKPGFFQAELKSLAGYLPYFAEDKLAFEPGARWQYSNAGFIVLGMIVEKVSGQDYFSYVREHIYKPAGMAASESFARDAQVENLATGYARGESNRSRLPWQGGPAGGGYSTAPDLLAFAGALRSGKLLKPETVTLHTTAKADIGPTSGYAYGFGDALTNGKRSYGHNGGFPGVNGELSILPELGYTVVVLANQDPPAASRIERWLVRRLTNQP